jgi:hypothetical protein
LVLVVQVRKVAVVALHREEVLVVQLAAGVLAVVALAVYAELLFGKGII